MSVEASKTISETDTDIHTSCDNFFESKIMTLVMKNKFSELNKFVKTINRILK